MSSSRRPRPSSMPTRRFRLEITGACQHEIAQPGETSQRLPASAFRRGESGDFRETTGDERGHGVVTKAEPFDRAGGNRNHVLERAANLHTSHIVARIQPKGRATKGLLHARNRGLIVGCREHCGRQALRHFRRKARARQDHGRVRTGPLLDDDLRHPRERAFLEAFCRADQDRAAPQGRRHSSNDSAQAVRWHGEHNARRVRGGLLDCPGDANPGGQGLVWKIARIRSRSLNRRGEIRISGPQPHVLAGPVEVDGQRCSPTSRAEDGDPVSRPRARGLTRAGHHARTPMRRSVPARRRRILARWRNRISAEVHADALTTAVDAPVSHAAGGKASVAASDPSET